MIEQEKKERYFRLVKCYLDDGGEEHLLAASDLGRKLLAGSTQVEGLAELHEDALQRLAENRPELSLIETTGAVSKPLVEMLKAYGIAFRQQNGSRARAAEEITWARSYADQLFESLADSLIVLSEDGVIQRVNTATLALLGYQSEELIGQPIEIVLEGGEENDFSPHASSNTQRVFDQAERTYLTKNGERIPVRFTASVVRRPSGEIESIVCVAHDARRRARLEDQLVQAQKMEAVGRLAAGVAHDFNNLLTVINGLADLALGRPSLEDSLVGDLKMIQQAGKEASELTYKLLAFGRKQVLRTRVLDLNGIVAEFENLLRRTLEEHIEIHTVLDPALGKVMADSGQIHQVLLNLAVNARDAMPAGGKFSIETRNVELDVGYADEDMAVKPGPYVEMVVSDSGDGMDEETRARIFEPFFTTKAAGEGTGLGLATVFGIVKRSDGAIRVTSELDRGTTIHVYLPRVEETDEAPEEARAAPDPEDGVTETILLVEDDTRVRDFVVRVLKQTGYRVLEAQNPPEALKICRQYKDPINLLITDIVMPGGTGQDLAVEFLALRPTTRLLYMSGYLAPESGLVSASAFLAKPFSPKVLTRKVKEVLE